MKKADNFNASKWLVENKITTQSKLNEEKPTNDMVENYWSIMVETQPEDVIEILVGLTNGDLPFEKFSLDTGNDIYDTFKDKLNEDEDESRLNEMATMIKKNSPFGSEKPLQVGDTIMWKTYSNDDRGMGSSVSGRLIGKVVKILGTANLQAEDIKTGDLYKVSRTELTRVPNVGDKIEATLSYNSGAGSGSQGSNKISGIVKKVNPEKFSMIIQTENSDKPSIIDLKDLSDVKIY